MANTLVKEAKDNLRRHIKAKLAHVQPESIVVQSENVLRTLESLEQFKNARRIALYMNMPNAEIQTRNIIRRCFELNKQVYLPKCIYGSAANRKHSHLAMLKVPTYKDVLDLRPQGKYKLLEPTHGESILDVGKMDVIIMPAVAFNQQKQRLGHGAGFYDEFLNVYKKKFNESPYLIGVGLKEQLIEQIPTEKHDWTLDCVVIDNLEPIL